MHLMHVANDGRLVYLFTDPLGSGSSSFGVLPRRLHPIHLSVLYTGIK